MPQRANYNVGHPRSFVYANSDSLAAPGRCLTYTKGALPSLSQGLKASPFDSDPFSFRRRPIQDLSIAQDLNLVWSHASSYLGDIVTIQAAPLLIDPSLICSS